MLRNKVGQVRYPKWQQRYDAVVERFQHHDNDLTRHEPWLSTLKESLQWDDLGIHCLWTAVDENGCFEMLRFDPRDCDGNPRLATIANFENELGEDHSVYTSLKPGDRVRLVEGVFTIVKTLIAVHEYPDGTCSADYGIDLGLTADQFHQFWNVTSCPEGWVEFGVRADFLEFAPIEPKSKIKGVPLDRLDAEEKQFLFSPWYATIACPPGETWRVECRNVNFLEAYAIWQYISEQYPDEDQELFGHYIVPNLAAVLLEAEDPQTLHQIKFVRGKFEIMGGYLNAYNWLDSTRNCK